MSDSDDRPLPAAPSGEPVAGTEPAEDVDTVDDQVRIDPGSAGDTAVVEDSPSAVAPADPEAGA